MAVGSSVSRTHLRQLSPCSLLTVSWLFTTNKKRDTADLFRGSPAVSCPLRSIWRPLCASTMVHLPLGSEISGGSHLNCADSAGEEPWGGSIVCAQSTGKDVLHPHSHPRPPLLEGTSEEQEPVGCGTWEFFPNPYRGNTDPA